MEWKQVHPEQEDDQWYGQSIGDAPTIPVQYFESTWLDGNFPLQNWNYNYYS